ncbi:sigma-70 family RNA polymerase sigma factor [Microlunatus elymi]|uniref:Sigma-70 family RNA polymerase sigma factor n=1 Tax=Microlunatus elymi TaxID=2596828 RepID=A0A516Q4N8_9ACTN|nr:RNA polymerase sigma factor SigJ [Microlunatus elymi]QDP98332.1 sigma-70 family RNA polymerase sigma factor [Microlunatus elymi]
MTDPSDSPTVREPLPGSGELDAVIMGERRRLLNVAYRLLGSLAEAEDAVQEAYTRWYSLSAEQQIGVVSPGAWLSTVTSRICLNVLRSARARRESYVGEWIPEPLPDTAPADRRLVPPTTDPADQITLDESVNMPLLVVLESMTPAERVAFILHDVFGYPFAEIAQIVGRTPGACRQLATSARRRVKASTRAPTSPSRDEAEIVREFKQAWQAKDVERLIGLLAPDAVATADGGGRVTTFTEPIIGGDQVAAAWAALADRATPDQALLERTVNGRPGLVAVRAGTVRTVFAFDVVGDRIQHIWVVANPAKLRPWQ